MTLTVSAVTETTATLTIADHSGNWYYEGNYTNRRAPCVFVASGTLTADLTNLAGGTDYTFKVYSEQGCFLELTTDSTDADFSTVGLTATSVAQNTATLNLANWTAPWWYKHTTPSSNTCTSVAQGTATANLSGLTPETDYTYEAYSATGCNTSNKIADVDFTTAKAAVLRASAITQTTATLTLSNDTGSWSYTGDNGQTCSAVTSRMTAGLASVPAQTFTQNAPVAALTLPAASGGDGALTYALAPALPAGLAFDPATRTIAGTPAASGARSSSRWWAERASRR